MSVFVNSDIYLVDDREFYIHGRDTRIEAKIPNTIKNNWVIIKSSYGEAEIKLTGNTVHDVVKAVMSASDVRTKKLMIQHLEMLIDHEENHYDT